MDQALVGNPLRRYCPSRSRGRKWLILSIFLILGTLLAPAAARAQSDTESLLQEGDYSTEHKAWNGLSTFAALAAGEGLQVIDTPAIDWESLDSDDVLVLLYPTNYVDPYKVVTFIRNGGRVLIADDFGTGDGILAELGGRRRRQFQADRYQDDQLFSPIAEPVGAHPLSANVTGLTTNHPSALGDLAGMTSIFRFASGESVVATGELGLGRYVALADPSVLINRMLQFEGNLQFSINLLRYLVRAGESDRLIVLSGALTLEGQPRNRYDDGTLRGSISANISQLDSLFDELNLYLFQPTSLRIATILAAALLCLFVFLVVPRPAHKPLDGAWAKASVGPMGPGPKERRKQRKSYLLPAAIERENIAAAIDLETGHSDALYVLSDTDLVTLVGEKCGPEASKALRALLPLIKSIPPRAGADVPYKSRHLGWKEFAELHRRAELFFDSLGRNAA